MMVAEQQAPATAKASTSAAVPALLEPFKAAGASFVRVTTQIAIHDAVKRILDQLIVRSSCSSSPFPLLCSSLRAPQKEPGKPLVLHTLRPPVPAASSHRQDEQHTNNSRRRVKPSPTLLGKAISIAEIVRRSYETAPAQTSGEDVTVDVEDQEHGTGGAADDEQRAEKPVMEGGQASDVQEPAAKRRRVRHKRKTADRPNECGGVHQYVALGALEDVGLADWSKTSGEEEEDQAMSEATNDAVILNWVQTGEGKRR